MLVTVPHAILHAILHAVLYCMLSSLRSLSMRIRHFRFWFQSQSNVTHQMSAVQMSRYAYNDHGLCNPIQGLSTSACILHVSKCTLSRLSHIMNHPIDVWSSWIYLQLQSTIAVGPWPGLPLQPRPGTYIYDGGHPTTHTWNKYSLVLQSQVDYL